MATSLKKKKRRQSLAGSKRRKQRIDAGIERARAASADSLSLRSRPVANARARSNSDAIATANRKTERAARQTTANKRDIESLGKRELFGGRRVYPAAVDGAIKYLPLKKHATQAELAAGSFIKDDSDPEGGGASMTTRDELKSKLKNDKENGFSPSMIQRRKKRAKDQKGEPDDDIAVKRDRRNRKVYPVALPTGDVQYLPLAKDATLKELSAGLFIKEGDIAPPAADDQSDAGEAEADYTPSPAEEALAKKEPFSGRKVYPAEIELGVVKYLPLKQNATQAELASGQYITHDPANAGPHDFVIKTAKGFDRKKAAEHKGYNRSQIRRRQDRAKGLFKNVDGHKKELFTHRKLYPVEISPGLVKYLPDQQHATLAELIEGAFIRDTPLESEGKADLSKKPIQKAQDGTALWDGRSMPDIEDEEILKKVLKNPKRQLGKNRMLYPVKTAEGGVRYLPLKKHASSREIAEGNFVRIVPPLGFVNPQRELQTFINGHLDKETFATEDGDITAFSSEQLAEAIKNADPLELRSQAFINDLTEGDSSLQQEWEP